MDEDEFMKELAEVTKDLEKEFNKKDVPAQEQKPNNSTNVISSTPVQSMNNPQTHPFNQNFDPLKMDFANMFQNYDISNDANNISQLKKLFSEMDNNDPESKLMLERISKLFLFNI